MTQYKIVSDNLAAGEAGKIVHDRDFPDGTNIEALIAGGHIVPVKSDKPNTKESN